MNESKVVLDAALIERVADLMDRLELSSKQSADVALIGSPEFFETKDLLRAALQKEERVEEAVEYRVLCDGKPLSFVHATLPLARRHAHELEVNHRAASVQSRKRLTGPWIDLPLEEGGE